MSSGFDPGTYWEARLRRDYDLAGVGYRRLGRAFNAWMYRVRGRVFRRAARALPIDWSGARVLDVGSGTGFYVDQWHRLGVPRLTGLDLTEVAVERLQLLFPQDEFFRLDIGRPPAAGDRGPAAGSLDAVSAMDVMFHIVDEGAFSRAFVNLATMLRSGGWLLWSDNFVHHAGDRVAHQASRPLAQSEAALAAAGFAVVERRPMFVLMNYPADTRSRIARLAWTAMVAPAALAEPLGWALGAALYPVECWLTARLAESPSTELMVCRKH